MRWFTIFVLALALTVPAAAQDQKPVKEKAPSGENGASEKDVQKPESPRFEDEDGDGIDDHVRQRTRARGGDGTSHQQGERRRDQFIDSDGDGINDSRCSGMGIEQGNRRRGGHK